MIGKSQIEIKNGIQLLLSKMYCSATVANLIKAKESQHLWEKQSNV